MIGDKVAATAAGNVVLTCQGKGTLACHPRKSKSSGQTLSFLGQRLRSRHRRFESSDPKPLLQKRPQRRQRHRAFL